jgi:hypothetical protein
MFVLRILRIVHMPLAFAKFLIIFEVQNGITLVFEDLFLFYFFLCSIIIFVILEKLFKSIIDDFVVSLKCFHREKVSFIFIFVVYCLVYSVDLMENVVIVLKILNFDMSNERVNGYG